MKKNYSSKEMITTILIIWAVIVIIGNITSGKTNYKKPDIVEVVEVVNIEEKLENDIQLYTKYSVDALSKMIVKTGEIEKNKSKIKHSEELIDFYQNANSITTREDGKKLVIPHYKEEINNYKETNEKLDEEMKRLHETIEGYTKTIERKVIEYNNVTGGNFTANDILGITPKKSNYKKPEKVIPKRVYKAPEKETNMKGDMVKMLQKRNGMSEYEARQAANAMFD